MTTDLIARRAHRLGPNLPTFYDDPVHIVRGEGAHLWDADGRRYIDCYNNVAHVGHCHPHVVEAIARQAATLNTHTRYLHAGILDYADRLTAYFRHDLSQVLFTCTGSEANDVALRMAQAVTGKTGFIATDNTYHGNTTAVAHLSTRRPPIGGWPDHIRRVPAPDSIAPLGGSLAAQPQAFAEGVAKAIAELQAAGHGFAGIMLCPVFANEGLPEVTSGFLAPTVEVVRRAGGLILCDEVQPGFGRIGTAFWGHERLGFAPDVVTLGKPMANGHPVAAVVTRPDIMAAFREAFGYFNTFAGNPVSMAAAAATLDVIEAEALTRHGEIIGTQLLDGMNALTHPQIASLRGAGMFLAMEFSDALGPNGAPVPHSANALCGRIVEGMRTRGVLLGRVGRQQHILKLRPPMPFGAAEARDVLAALGDCLESEQTA